jgi:hypothetical protein
MDGNPGVAAAARDVAAALLEAATIEPTATRLRRR